MQRKPRRRQFGKNLYQVATREFVLDQPGRELRDTEPSLDRADLGLRAAKDDAAINRALIDTVVTVGKELANSMC